jgi:hypothetical protein
MEYQVTTEGGKTIVECVPRVTLVGNEQELLDFIMLCGAYAGGEDETAGDRILLYDDNLPETFYDLKTKVAGNYLQKLVNYRVKAAFVVSEERVKGRFGEMVLESRRSRQARFFTDREPAVNWLASD